MPKVSICIPAYKRVAMLLTAADSVRRQAYSDWELVVVHDGTNPELREALNALGDHRIRYFENAVALGVPGNWNRCIREARGEYVQILPDDDALGPGFLQRTTAVLDQNLTLGFVQTGGYNCDDQLRPVLSYTLPGAAGIRKGAEALEFQFTTNRCMPATLLFRKKILEDTGLWREDYFLDDSATILKIAWRHGFYYLAEGLSAVRAHGQNYSGRLAKSGTDGLGAMLNQTIDVFGACQPMGVPELALMRSRMRSMANRFAKAALGHLLRGRFAVARFEFRRAMLLAPSSVWALGFLQAWYQQRISVRFGRMLARGAHLADRPFHLWEPS